MTEIETFVSAGPGEVFAPDAFDLTVGTTVPLRIAGRVVTDVEVVAADVIPGGKGVRLTLRIGR